MKCENEHCKYKAEYWYKGNKYCYVHYLLELSKEELEERDEREN